jgi:hypothetical protein
MRTELARGHNLTNGLQRGRVQGAIAPLGRRAARKSFGKLTDDCKHRADRA